MNLAASLGSRFQRWALRGPEPESAPIRLTRKRVFVLPTRFGLAYCLLLLVMLVAAINYDLNLAHAQVFLLAGVGVVSMFHAFRNLAQLRIAPGRAAPVFLGAEARFCLILTNPSDRPRVALGLSLPGQAEQEVDVPTASSCEVTLALPTRERGWLAMPRVRLSTAYPLGLIRAWAYAAPDLRCLVYPAPHPQPPPACPTPADEGGTVDRKEGLEDFAGLRLHQPADPLRRVAWKAAARTEQGPLLTKLFDGGAAQTVWLDFDSLPGTDLETRLSLLARGVCDARATGIACGLRLPGETLEPAADEAHYATCLAALALFGHER